MLCWMYYEMPKVQLHFVIKYIRYVPTYYTVEYFELVNNTQFNQGLATDIEWYFCSASVS